MSRRSKARNSLEEVYEIGEYGINVDRLLKRCLKDYNKIKEAGRERRRKNYIKRKNGYYAFRGVGYGNY